MFKIPLVFSFTEKYQPLKYEAFKKAKENCVHLLNILTSLAGNDLSFLINKNKEALKPPESLSPKEKELFLKKQDQIFDQSLKQVLSYSTSKDFELIQTLSVLNPKKLRESTF